MLLTAMQMKRHERNLKIKPIGKAGQQRLLSSRVLVIGAGGLGSPAIWYLAAAGVGTLGIIDSDVVDLSNLQRQIIHGMPDIGRSKTESASEKVERLNPEVKVVTGPQRLNAGNISATQPACGASSRWSPGRGPACPTRRTAGTRQASRTCSRQ